MGQESSRAERNEFNPYHVYDENDRDDYDNCCGCGPWYGGKSYRELRRRNCPGYGSPPHNYFGREGYAGYLTPAGRAAVARTEMGLLPYEQSMMTVGPHIMQGPAIMPGDHLMPITDPVAPHHVHYIAAPAGNNGGQVGGMW